MCPFILARWTGHNPCWFGFWQMMVSISWFPWQSCNVRDEQLYAKACQHTVCHQSDRGYKDLPELSSRGYWYLQLSLHFLTFHPFCRSQHHRNNGIIINTNEKRSRNHVCFDEENRNPVYSFVNLFFFFIDKFEWEVWQRCQPRMFLKILDVSCSLSLLKKTKKKISMLVSGHTKVLLKGFFILKQFRYNHFFLTPGIVRSS